MVYDHIKSRTPLNVLHICNSNIELGRFADLNPAIVNCIVYQNKVSPTEGSHLIIFTVPKLMSSASTAYQKHYLQTVILKIYRAMRCV